MAKKHKNIEKIFVKWDGTPNHPDAGNKNQSIPGKVDIMWGGYTPCWYKSGPDRSHCYTQECCSIENMYFEDFDIARNPNNAGVEYFPDKLINVSDITAWLDVGRSDLTTTIVNMILGNTPMVDKGPTKSYTWNDVFFIQEIVDGIGTGSRRAREVRLNQFEQEKKKRLIRLICRVKGEKVYDEEKEMGDTYIKLEDAELVINEVLGKIRVENANVV
tara:strand:- start:121 stop:771 length:651 start_codon:yes stop_codon:yes gene_type:complete